MTSSRASADVDKTIDAKIEAGREGWRRRAVSLTPVAEAGASAPAFPAPDRRRARRRAGWRRRLTVLAFLSPWLAGFCVFFGYPLVMTGYLSFTHYDLLNPPRWIGFANYSYILHSDNQIWPAVYNTLWIIVIGVPLQVLFAFGDRASCSPARAAGVGLLPDGLLSARAGPAGCRDARVRLPPEPGDRARSTCCSAPRDRRTALVQRPGAGRSRRS